MQCPTSARRLLSSSHCASAPRTPRRAGGLRVSATAVADPKPPAPAVKKAAPKPRYTTVDLPPLSQEFVPAQLPEAAYGAARKADAIVLEPKGVAKGATVPAVVFCHGFSQPPTNYLSTLERFAEQGWLVIAPTTSLLDIAFSDIETVGKRGKPPAKLQTALILDALRSAQLAKGSTGLGYKVSDILLAGHSMGGAGALVAASKLQGLVKGVGVAAPAVKQTLKTAVNPGLSMGDKAGQAAAVEFFKDDYPTQAPLHILAGKRDLIVTQTEIRGLYDAAFAGDATGDLKLYWLPGSHIGFEDEVDLEWDGLLPQRIFFAIINFLLYKAEITKLITGDYSDQRALAQQLLVGGFQAALAGAGTDAQIERGMEDVSLAPTPSPEELKELQELGPAPADAPWVLPTALLLSYAGAHAFTLSSALGLLGSPAAAGLAPLSAAGIAIVATIAAGLVYENVILASGRFITNTGKDNLGLLDALNDPRFLFHSGAPLLAVTGLDLGQRLGVGWASNGWLEGGVAAALTVVVALSTLRNTLLLQTKPTWSWGILHFTYDDPGFDFTRIIPVAAVTLLLTALGASATLADPSQWPFFVGPAACLALSAGVIPRTKAPMIITGNAGEALMLLSLVITEAGLLGKSLL